MRRKTKGSAVVALLLSLTLSTCMPVKAAEIDGRVEEKASDAFVDFTDADKIETLKENTGARLFEKKFCY